nr:porin family protein [uncultured Porphyromonas sp.]
MIAPRCLLLLGMSLCVPALVGGTEAHAQQGRPEHQPYVDLRRYYLGFRIGIHTSDLRLVSRGRPTPEGTTLWGETPSYQPGFSIGVIGGLALGSGLELRLLPTLHLGESEVAYTDGRREVGRYSVKMHSVSLPLELKWGALRLGNIRPFVSAGIYTQTMLGGGRGDVLRLRRMDYGSSLGVGCDFYFRLFKLSPQLTFSYGVGNVLDTDRPDLREDRRIYYTQALERVGTRMILLSLSFE